MNKGKMNIDSVDVHFKRSVYNSIRSNNYTINDC